MKKIALIISAAAFVLVSGQSAFAREYGVAGCGLGSVLMGKKDSQVLAVTTNGTFYTQLFGITSGTSNCTDDGTTKSSMVIPQFIDANREALATDVARGSGETLANLSEAMGCDDAAHLASALQQNYRVIFSSAQVESAQITDSIKHVVKSDSQLASSCQI